MSAWIRFSLALLGLFPLSVPAQPAQAPTGQSLQPPAGTATSSSPAGNAFLLGPPADHRISLDVVVTDKSGNPQSGLQPQDFTILDDRQPGNILSFRATEQGAAAESIQVVFLLDAVNTGVQTMARERQQLENFLRQDGGHLALPTSLGFFSDTSTEVQPVATHDGNGLADFLHARQIDQPIIGRSQAIYGAIDRFKLSVAAVQKLAGHEARQPGRKLLIWFSPGWPFLNGPRIELTGKNQDWLFNTIVALSRSLREARVTLYSLDPGTSDAGAFRTSYYESFLEGVPSSDRVLAGHLALQVLATQTGGKVLDSKDDLNKLIASCLLDAKAYYTISFLAPPAGHPNEYHSFEVKVDKPGLIARTRTGYYAQPYKDAGR